MDKVNIKSSGDILDRYEGGERDFTGLELDADMIDGDVLDLSGVILDHADFSNCWLSASFRNSRLRGALFKNANVKSCDFSGADLTDADFTGAAMEAATWHGATLVNTVFGEVSLYGRLLSEDKFIQIIKDEGES